MLQGMFAGKSILWSGVLGGAIAALTIGPLAYSVGYFKAGFEHAVKLEDCQDKLNGYILAESERVSESSQNLETQIEEFTKIQNEMLEGINTSAERERQTAHKLRNFENAIEKLEIPNCTANGVGRELRGLTD